MIAFTPDAPYTTPNMLMDVEALPTFAGYGGAPSNVTAGYAALAAACNGAVLLYKLDGSTRLIAGTQSKLYEGSGGTWSDVSRGGAYTTGDVKWRFAQFGDRSLAVSQSIQLQQSTSGAFADIANAPKAALMESVGGFIMLASTDDTGTGLGTGYGLQQNRWWCSAIFSPTTTWSPSVTNQCTSGLLVSAPGAITALKRLGDNCVAYKQRAIYMGQYVGAPDVWRWDLVAGEIGVANNECVVSIGSSHLFIGYEDIYQFDGSRPVAIGEGIKKWFFANLNKTYQYKIEGIHDYNTQSVWWFYPKGTATTLTAALIYNYKTGKWGHITKSIECPLTSVISGVTYDGFGALFTTYEDIPAIGFDSPFWQGGAPINTVIDTSHVLYTLTGSSTSGYIKTGYYGDDEMVSTCTRVRPRMRTKATTSTITPYTLTYQGGTPVTGTASSINVDRFDVMQASRWHNFLLSFTGDFEIEEVLPKFVGNGNE